MKLGLINLLVCFFITILIAPLIIKWLRKLKFGQEILVYVEQHKTKSGTPTMGGIIVILSAVIGYLIFLRKDNILATICILSLVFFGVLGFLDDFIKIRLKHNEGLKPYQKVIGQLGLSVILAVFIFMSDLVGTEIAIPFTNKVIDIGFWIIPFVIFYYVAVVNSVNLIDGLDGLCSGVSSVVILVLTIILTILQGLTSSVYFNELNNIIIVSLGVVGALFGILCFNGYPAKVFLGDTGSLAIGGFIASITALTKNYLLLPIVGIVYVLTTLSVIIQVMIFKITKKRVFKMSPLHHHFESYMHESKVTLLYIISTILVCFITIMFYI